MARNDPCYYCGSTEHITWDCPKQQKTDREEVEVVNEYPWNHPHLKGWDIVGMNHYHVNGQRRLFVAMTRGRRCIKAEGEDEQRVFNGLAMQAWDPQEEVSDVEAD
jgi:hypothetical protein